MSIERRAELRESLADALRLYVLTDTSLYRGRTDADVVRAAIAGGATAIQLRWKNGPLRDAVTVGRVLRRICRDAGVLFVVNDRVDLALALAADGVHLGEDDFPVPEARELVGERMIIGYSPAGREDARRAVSDGADYLGVGPAYVTRTKQDAGAAIGVDGIAAIVDAVNVPVVGIGGIGLDRVGAVMSSGAAGIAVISAVVGADDVEVAARQLRQAVDDALVSR